MNKAKHKCAAGTGNTGRLPAYLLLFLAYAADSSAGCSTSSTGTFTPTPMRHQEVGPGPTFPAASRMPTTPLARCWP